MIRRRGVIAGVLLAAVLVMAGCAGFPVSGSVNRGLPVEEGAEGPDLVVRPDSPQPGATPEQIVNGFLRAGSGPGPLRDWSVAQEFLAPEAEWDPRAGVTIETAGERTPPLVTEEGAHVSVTIAPVATVDALGAYETSAAGSTELGFSLAQVDGEWRITQAPDGVVLDRGQFPNVFRPYSIMYWDTSWTYLVPDLRWFTPTNVATQIAKALVDGTPSPWIAASVYTAFPEGTSLAQRSVPVDAQGMAHVELSSEALAAGEGSLERMQAQIEESLRSARISSVQLAVGPTVLEAQAAPVRSTRVAPLPLVLTEGGFGFLAGDELTGIPGLSEAVAASEAVAIQVSSDQDAAAVRLADGTVARVEENREPRILDTRSDLVDPTIDPFGYVWSAPHAVSGVLTAFAPDGAPIEIDNAFAGAAHLAAMTVSRDGTRLAAAVVIGGRTAIWVVGIVRDAEGVPTGLGDDPLVLGSADWASVGIAWVDDSTLGVLTRSGDETRVIEQPVGGPPSTTIGPETAAGIAGGNTTSPVRLRTDDGALLIKRGANWQETADGIKVLATQQGLPE